MMTYSKRVMICLLTLTIILTFIHYNDLDIKFQSLFFDFEQKTWLINNNMLELRFMLYRLPKYLIVAYGICLILWETKLYLYKQDKELQKKLLFLVSVLIFTPLTVAILKHYSPVHCPHNIKEFGGGSTHISPLNIFKDNNFLNHYGKCFPAGHASGGFSLISLYFVMPTQRLKYCALFGSLCLGVIMGMYQITKGVHYLSDTIATLTIAYLVSITVQRLLLTSQL